MVEMLTLPVRRAERQPGTESRTGETVPDPAHTGPFRRMLHAVGMVWTITRSMLTKAWQDRILGLSAESAFWQLLSVSPLMLAVLSVLGYAGRWTGTDLIDRVESHA